MWFVSAGGRGARSSCVREKPASRSGSPDNICLRNAISYTAVANVNPNKLDPESAPLHTVVSEVVFAFIRATPRCVSVILYCICVVGKKLVIVNWRRIWLESKRKLGILYEWNHQLLNFGACNTRTLYARKLMIRGFLEKFYLHMWLVIGSISVNV